MVVGMKRLIYFLALAILSAQLDEAWVVVPLLPSAPLADDNDENDECLPAQRQPREEATAACRGPLFVGQESPTAEIPFVRAGVPFESLLTTPSLPPSLYVFMSLQI